MAAYGAIRLATYVPPMCIRVAVAVAVAGVNFLICIT